MYRQLSAGLFSSTDIVEYTTRLHEAHKTRGKNIQIHKDTDQSVCRQTPFFAPTRMGTRVYGEDQETLHFSYYISGIKLGLQYANPY